MMRVRHGARGMTLVELLLASLIVALVSAGLVRSFTAHGEYLESRVSVRNAERSVGAAIEIMGRAIERAGFVGCAPARSTTSSNPPWRTPVDLEQAASGVALTVHGVEKPLRVMHFTTDEVLVDGRWSGKPKRGRVLAMSSCRGVFWFSVAAVRHIGGSALPRTELAGDLSGASEVVALAETGPFETASTTGRRATASLIDGLVRPPNGTTVGLVHSRRYFIRANQDGGRSLWVAENGGRATELVRDVDKLEVDALGRGLYAVRVEAESAIGTVIRERFVRMRNAVADA